MKGVVETADIPMLGWCDRSALIRAGIPSRWCEWFLHHHADETRKLGDSQQSKRLYSIQAVNAALERGETGIEDDEEGVENEQ